MLRIAMWTTLGVTVLAAAVAAFAPTGGWTGAWQAAFWVFGSAFIGLLALVVGQQRAHHEPMHRPPHDSKHPG